MAGRSITIMSTQEYVDVIASDKTATGRRYSLGLEAQVTAECDEPGAFVGGKHLPAQR